MMPQMVLTEKLAVMQCARTFGVFQNACFPNVFIFGAEMDLAVVTRAGYLWECEVKLTLADWKADEKKRKWSHPSRRYITRFFYAVPENLLSQVPSFVPASAGLLKIGADLRIARTVRTARRRAGPKLPPEQIKALYESLYYRFWRQWVYHNDTLMKRLRNKQARHLNDG